MKFSCDKMFSVLLLGGKTKICNTVFKILAGLQYITVLNKFEQYLECMTQQVLTIMSF